MISNRRLNLRKKCVNSFSVRGWKSARETKSKPASLHVALSLAISSSLNAEVNGIEIRR
jgi:hypothetical protein